MKIAALKGMVQDNPQVCFAFLYHSLRPSDDAEDARPGEIQHRGLNNSPNITILNFDKFTIFINSPFWVIKNQQLLWHGKVFQNQLYLKIQEYTVLIFMKRFMKGSTKADAPWCFQISLKNKQQQKWFVYKLFKRAQQQTTHSGLAAALVVLESRWDFQLEMESNQLEWNQANWKRFRLIWNGSDQFTWNKTGWNEMEMES